MVFHINFMKEFLSHAHRKELKSIFTYFSLSVLEY